MKLKKLLTSVAAIAAATMLLTACTSSGGNNGDGKDNPGNSNEDVKYLTVADFSSTDERLSEVPNISAYFSRFNQEYSSSIGDELLASSVASYLDSTAYGMYFIADWWGEKDDFSNKGFSNFDDYVSESLLEEIKTLNKDKNKDPLGEKYFFHQPSENTKLGYGPSKECFDTWEMVSCMYPYQEETMNIVSSNNHRAIVEVTSNYTVYLVDEYGDSREQKITYSATLELENNKKLTDIKTQPFFVVKKIDGAYTYGEITEPVLPGS